MEDKDTFIYQFVYKVGEIDAQNRGYITRSLPFLCGTYDITFLNMSANCLGSIEEQTLILETKELNFPLLLWTTVLSNRTVNYKCLQLFSRLTEYSDNSQQAYNSFAPLTDNYNKNGGFTLYNQQLTGQLSFRLTNSGANAGATSGTALSTVIYNTNANSTFIFTLKFKKIF